MHGLYSSGKCLSEGSKSGAEGIRTLDPHVANVVLSQLSYCPTVREAGIVLRSTPGGKENLSRRS
jgi:hypothetical protein